jgi:hypothetical protein
MPQISIRTIEAAIAEKKEHSLVLQISRYDNSNNEYLVFSSATQDPFKKDHLSISVGILHATMKKKFKFIDSGIVKKEIVGVTCETCAVKIAVRATPPIQNKKSAMKI